MDKLPLVSGESGPNISVINARLLSRLIECVAPIASLFRPNNRAIGNAKKMVPKLPISCNNKAGPAEMTVSRLAPH